jgi:hypothetical protein
MQGREMRGGLNAYVLSASRIGFESRRGRLGQRRMGLGGLTHHALGTSDTAPTCMCRVREPMCGGLRNGRRSYDEVV